MATNVEFPNNRSILWDRTLISGVYCINAFDVIPPLHISAVSIFSILEELHTTETTIERRALIEHISLLDDQHTRSQFQHRSVIGSHTSVLKIDANFFDQERKNETHSVSCLTIPIFRRPLSDFGLSFEKESTQNLLVNLGKGIRIAKNTSLRSCMRVRAAGIVQRQKLSLKGTLRFEAVLPNISFHVQQIRAIPVLSTPLSVKLARRTSSGCHTGGPPQVGYVTLNQTRKIVPLLEIDPAVSIAPIVGVWTAFDEISDITIKSTNTNINSPTGDHSNSHENSTEYSSLSNTLSWAAMIRFLYNENIKDRVFISGDTFLLVNFGETCVTCFEVTQSPGRNFRTISHISTFNNSNNIRNKDENENKDENDNDNENEQRGCDVHPVHSTRKHQSLSLSEEFLCLDFTVDLDIAIDEQGCLIPNTTEPVFCKFKPLTNVTNIREFRSCSENTETNHIRNMKVQQNKMRRENGEIEILDKYTSKIVSNNAPPITDIRRKMITLPGEMVENIDNTVTKNLKEYENQGKEKEIDTKNNNTNVLKSFRKSSDLSLNPYNDRVPDSLISRIYSNMESLTPVPRADIPSPICHPTLPSSYPFPLSHIAPTLHQSLPPSFNNTSKNFNTKNSSVSLSLSVSSSHTLPHSEYSRNDSREISSSCSSFNPNLASRLHTTSTTSSYHPSSSSSSYESSSTLPTTSSYPSSSLITSSYPATSFSSTNHDSSQRQVTKKDDINSNNLPHSTKTENKHNQNTINRIISTGNHGKKDFSSDFESSFLSFSSSDVDHDNKKAYVHFEGRGGKVESSRGIMMSRDDDGDRRGYGVKEGDYDERGVVDYNCVSGDVNDSSNNDDSNYRGDNDDNRGLNINYNNNNNDDSVGRYNENGDNNDNNYDNNNTEASDNSIHNNYSSKNRNSNEYQNRHFNNNEKSIRREEINNGKMLKIRNSQESVIENNKGDEKFDTYMHERIMKIENKNCKQFDSYSHNKNGNYDESDKKNECNNDNHGIANDKYNRAMSEKHNDINSINNHTNNSKEFQSELYLLQEKKIESLEAQIQELKDLVLSLGLVKKTEGQNVNAFSSSEKLSQKSDKSNYVLKSINKNSIHAANDEMGSFEDSENSDFDNKISNKMKKISIQKSREETVKKSMTRNDQNVHHQKPKSPLSSSSVSASVKKTENKVTISSKEFFMILENQRNFDKNCFEKEHNGDFDSFKIREKGMNVDQDETESVFSNEKIHINEMDKINTKFKIKSKAEKLKDPHFNIQNDQDYKIEEGAITFRSSEKTSVGDDKNNNGRNDSSSDVANRNNNLKNNDNDNYNDDYEDDDNNNNNNDDNYNGNGDNNHDKEKGGVEGREYLPKSFPQSNSLRQNKSYRFGEVLKTTETDCPREHSSEQSDRKNLPSDRTDNSQPYIHTPVLQSNGALSGVPERRSGAGGQNNGYRGIYPRRGSDLLGGGLFERDTGGRVPANTAKDISAPSVLSSSHTTPTTSSSSSSSSFPPSFPPSSFPSSSSSSASSSSFPSSFPLRQQQQFTDSVKPNNPNPCSDHAIDEKPLNFRFENDLSRLKTKKSNFYLTNKSSFLLQKRENSDVNQIKFGNMMNAEDGFSRNSEVMHNFRSNQFQLTNSRRIPYNSTSEYEEPTLV